MVEHQSLNVFAFANPQKSTSAKTSFRVNAIRGCVVAGASWMSWDTEGDEWRGWDSSDPDVITERHSIGGAYTRLRVPLGLSFGRSFNVKKVSFTPFVNPFVVYERETFAPNTFNGTTTSSRTSYGGGLATGFTMRAGWFVMRPTITVTNTRDRALSGKRNWADPALHFGVVF